MKKIILVLGLLFSIMVSAVPYQVSGDDFDVFPLNASNVSFLEGTWTGKSIVIEVRNLETYTNGKPYLWLQITNKKDVKDVKFGVIYFNEPHQTYELYVFGLKKTIPIKIGIFEYSKLFASRKEMNCKSGGSILQVEFELSDMQTGRVQLQRELCAHLKDFNP